MGLPIIRDISEVVYIQGWLVGVSSDGPALIPYEMVLRRGRGILSHSGSVNLDLIGDFRLAIWAVELCLSRFVGALPAVDVHLHLPLNNIQGSGPSCRLSLVNSLLQAWLESHSFCSSTTILLGDISLGGNVLPVGCIDQKMDIVKKAGFTQIVLPSQVSTFPDTLRISSIVELLPNLS